MGSIILNFNNKFLSTRYYALLLILITILPVLGLMLYHNYEDRSDAIKVIRNQTMDVLRDINRSQENILDSTHDLLIALGQHPSIRSFSETECKTTLTEALNKYTRYNSLSAYKPDGTRFCSTADDGELVEFKNSELFKSSLTTKSLVTSKYIISPSLDKPILVISHAVADKAGDVKAFLNASLSMGWLEKMLGRLPLYDNARLTVFDHNGKILLAHPGYANNIVGQPYNNRLIINEALKNPYLSVKETTNFYGAEIINAIGPLGSDKTLAFITLSVPKDTALAPSYQQLLESLSLTAIISILAILFAFSWTQHLFISPIKELVTATRRLRSGKFGSQSTLESGPAELKELGVAFNEMSSSIARQTNVKNRVETALRQLIQGTKKHASEEFFTHAVSILGKYLEADICLIAMIDQDNPDKIITKSMYSKNSSISNLKIDLINSPAKQVLTDQTYCIFPDAVQQEFPDDQLLTELGIEAYAGTALIDYHLNIRGLLAVMTSTPIEDRDMYQSLIQVFGARITAEIERLDTDNERQKLLEETQLTATAFDTHEGMFITDPNKKVLRVNNAFSELTGFSDDQVIGNSPFNLINGCEPHINCNLIWEEAEQHGKWQGEATITDRQGIPFPVKLTLSAVANKNKVTTYYVAHFQDIRQQKEYEAKIKHLAYHDALTQLPNRSLLIDRLDRLISSMKRRNSHGAILFIDLDHFKEINDTLGHNIGDKLLIEVSRRMKESLREEDTVSRFGGDEFVILLSQLNQDRQLASITAHKISQKIHKKISEEYAIVEHTLKISSSIGIALFPDENNTAEDFLRHADLAMYDAKGTGRDTIRFFKQEMQSIAVERLSLEHEVRSGFENNEFVLYHQPQVDLSNGNIIGSELLMRWNHPKNGLVFPGTFISVMEKGNLIHSVGEWAIQTACDSINKQNSLQLDFPTKLVTSVNISSSQFQDRNFISTVENILEKSGIDGEQLAFEITENIVIQDIDDTINKMKALKKYGLQFSIDDFGTGYSSLSYIKKLPIDTLKIDRSFIIDCITDPNDNAIVRTIISMAKTLGLEIIAEGVEDIDQLNLLAHLNCNAYQGFYFSRAIPEHDYLKMLTDHIIGNASSL